MPALCPRCARAVRPLCKNAPYIQMGEWVGGFVGGMVHLMDLPLSSWGYGLAPFWLGILRPLLLFVMELSIGDTVFYTIRDRRDS